jgi:methionyl-tRNA formyltransferase
MQHRIIFMGTPQFSVPVLRVLAERFDTNALLVATQPDRPAGRGRTVQSPPVQAEAEALRLESVQVDTLRDPEVRSRFEAFGPSLIVVAAFGRILPNWVLDLPERGCVNVHASNLPRFRGASPIAAAIACGDERTAVALMRMEPGLDTGPVFATIQIDIMEDDTTGTLTTRLAGAGARLIDEHVTKLLDDALEAVPQRGDVIETRKIVKAHGAIDWSRAAGEIECHVRAMWPWPRAWTIGEEATRLQVHEAEVLEGVGAIPGTVMGHDRRGVLVASGNGIVRLVTVQIAGRTAQPARELRQHRAFDVGASLTAGEGFVWPAPWIEKVGMA